MHPDLFLQPQKKLIQYQLIKFFPSSVCPHTEYNLRTHQTQFQDTLPQFKSAVFTWQSNNNVYLATFIGWQFSCKLDIQLCNLNEKFIDHKKNWVEKKETIINQTKREKNLTDND